MTNIQSTLLTVLELYKNVSPAVLFANSSNSYTFSTQSYMCVCLCSYQHRDAGRAKEIKNWIAVNAVCQESFPATSFQALKILTNRQLIGKKAGRVTACPD